MKGGGNLTLFLCREESMKEKKRMKKKSICELFDVPIDTLNKHLAKMKKNPDFQKYIFKTGYKELWIDPKGYEEFLFFKQKQYENKL